uniref:Uncharacterized protein n=1 Tax=Spongospora subterranea TaxID=70186 RepID=A0A0H5R8S5_9EUKA|eukprot:CRZ04774.1 hypothetical protein [Spongospora subterranea]
MLLRLSLMLISLCILSQLLLVQLVQCATDDNDPNTCTFQVTDTPIRSVGQGDDSELIDIDLNNLVAGPATPNDSAEGTPSFRRVKHKRHNSGVVTANHISDVGSASFCSRDCERKNKKKGLLLCGFGSITQLVAVSLYIYACVFFTCDRPHYPLQNLLRGLNPHQRSEPTVMTGPLNEWTTYQGKTLLELPDVQYYYSPPPPKFFIRQDAPSPVSPRHAPNPSTLHGPALNPSPPPLHAQDRLIPNSAPPPRKANHHQPALQASNPPPPPPLHAQDRLIRNPPPPHRKANRQATRKTLNPPPAPRHGSRPPPRSRWRGLTQESRDIRLLNEFLSSKCDKPQDLMQSSHNGGCSPYFRSTPPPLPPVHFDGPPSPTESYMHYQPLAASYSPLPERDHAQSPHSSRKNLNPPPPPPKWPAHCHRKIAYAGWSLSTVIANLVGALIATAGRIRYSKKCDHLVVGQ